MKQPILYFGVSLAVIITGLEMGEFGNYFVIGGSMLCAITVDRWFGESAYQRQFIDHTLRMQGKVIEALGKRGLVVFVDPDTNEVQVAESVINKGETQ